MDSTFLPVLTGVVGAALTAIIQHLLTRQNQQATAEKLQEEAQEIANRNLRSTYEGAFTTLKAQAERVPTLEAELSRERAINESLKARLGNVAERLVNSRQVWTLELDLMKRDLEKKSNDATELQRNLYLVASQALGIASYILDMLEYGEKQGWDFPLDPPVDLTSFIERMRNIGVKVNDSSRSTKIQAPGKE